jgi:hypothetical protein
MPNSKLGSQSDIYLHTSKNELKDPALDMVQKLSKDVYYEID